MPQNEISVHTERFFANNVETVLFDETTIRNRVLALANQINTTYAGSELTIIVIANGALIFAADLIRKLNLPVRLDCIHVSSYQNQTTSTKTPEIINSIQLNIKDANTLLIDDILDTGNTLLKVLDILWAKRPASIKTCVLLDKKSRRSVDIEADFVGFEIPDRFVVGYGLDYAEYYRQLPYIGVIPKELQ
jgi:hypoxanthine phosphoribosyltransferase